MMDNHFLPSAFDEKQYFFPRARSIPAIFSGQRSSIDSALSRSLSQVNTIPATARTNQDQSTSISFYPNISPRMDPKIQGTLAAIVIFLAATFIIAIIFLLRKTHLSSRGSNPTHTRQSEPIPSEISSYDPSLQISMPELLRATSNFSPDGIIGDGSFGLVYKARLSNGITVAIKKLSSDTFQGFREFRAEMDTLGKLTHKHIAKLLGYCAWGSERLLVYQFIQRGSLDQWLHETSPEYDLSPKKTPLDWRTRVKVVNGVARGLCYLHGLKSPVIHRDIKSSNVLLDEDFEAHITDFGLARMLDSSHSHVSTQVAGTMGYMPPEFREGLTAATVKADVYSFGTLMIEVATGRRPSWPVKDRSGTIGFVQWARMYMAMGRAIEMVDPNVERSHLDESEVVEFFRVACSCTEELAKNRPAMGEVVDLLSRVGS